jgi:hypothetical protein
MPLISTAAAQPGFILGGQLLDRSPYTAARVHNGFGISCRLVPDITRHKSTVDYDNGE